MSDTTDILRIATSFLDQQERKKQQAFQNSMQLSELARGIERQNIQDQNTIARTYQDVAIRFGSLLNDLGVKEEEVFNATDLSEETFKSASSMLNNAKMSIADQFKKVNDTMLQVINARNTMVGKQNELLSEWHDAAMSDNDLYFSPEEVNKWVEDRGGMAQLTGFESRWLQDYIGKNAQVTANKQKIQESIDNPDWIKFDTLAAYSDFVEDGAGQDEAFKKTMNFIENNPKMTSAQMNIAKSLLFNNASNLMYNKAKQEKLIADEIDDDFKEQRTIIKTRQRYVASNFNNYVKDIAGIKKLTTMDMSPESIDGDLQNITESIYDILRYSDDSKVPNSIQAMMKTIANTFEPNERFQMMSDLISILSGNGTNPNKRVISGNSVVTLAEKYGIRASDANEGFNLLNKFDWSDSPFSMGSTNEGLGESVHSLVALKEEMEKYKKDFEDAKHIDGLNLNLIRQQYKEADDGE